LSIAKNRLTRAELKTLRTRLGLPVNWCAERIGHVSLRTWRYWEQGRDGQAVAIPADVVDQLRLIELALKPWAKQSK
jgi:Domain of unknown function (DUF1870)